jgi:thiol-disulfide isomerase/thioredoxin
MPSAFNTRKIAIMLKKLGSGVLYLSVMFALGLCIYYFFLAPNQNNSSNNVSSSVSTDHFFSAKLTDTNNKVVSMREYQGKILVINFWATWCAPCREEMPELSLLQDKYKNQNVVVLGIAIDEASAIKTFQTQTPVNYQIFVSENEGLPLAERLGNNKGVLPYTLIIDQHGKIAKNYFGKINYPMLADEITPLLQ